MTVVKIALAVFVCALAGAVPAHAAPRRPWAHVTRAPLPHPMPEIHYEQCPGNADAYGCAFMPGEASVDGRVFARGAVFLSGRDRFAKLHEVGHVFAQTMMDADERWAYKRVRGMEDLAWTWSDEMDGMVVQGASTPDEDFADAYANCRMQRTPYGLWEAGYGYYPTPREHWRVCQLIALAGQDPGYPVTADEIG